MHFIYLSFKWYKYFTEVAPEEEDPDDPAPVEDDDDPENPGSVEVEDPDDPATVEAEESKDPAQSDDNEGGSFSPIEAGMVTHRSGAETRAHVTPSPPPPLKRSAAAPDNSGTWFRRESCHAIQGRGTAEGGLDKSTWLYYVVVMGPYCLSSSHQWEICHPRFQ